MYYLVSSALPSTPSAPRYKSYPPSIPSTLPTIPPNLQSSSSVSHNKAVKSISPSFKCKSGYANLTSTMHVPSILSFGLLALSASAGTLEVRQDTDTDLKHSPCERRQRGQYLRQQRQHGLLSRVRRSHQSPPSILSREAMFSPSWGT